MLAVGALSVVVTLNSPGSQGLVPDGGDPASLATPIATAGPTMASPTAAPTPGVPPAAVTDTGIPVAVISGAADGPILVTTPCGRQASISDWQRLDGATVVIDPGHGGAADTGAVQNGIVERDLNMAVADAMATELRARGIDVVLTRTSDYQTILPVRAQLADALGARVMVSIHHNSAGAAPPTSAVPGTEVFVQATSESQRLGRLLYDAVTATLGSTFDVPWYRSSDAGVLRVTQPDGQETYGMIRIPATTTALIEMGWLLNPAEAQAVYATPTFPLVAGAALADAVEQYLAGTSSDAPIRRRLFTARPALTTAQCTDPELEALGG